VLASKPNVCLMLAPLLPDLPRLPSLRSVGCKGNRSGRGFLGLSNPGIVKGTAARTPRSTFGD
jgi:hypothetical protein